MARPLAVKRHDRILADIDKFGAVSVAELAEALDVSRETIRRDLKLLADRGFVDIVHGGATRLGAADRISGAPAIRPGGELATAAPDITEPLNGGSAHEAVRRAVMRLVSDGMGVLVDASLLCGAVAEGLSARRGLTVITNSLAVANRLVGGPGVRVVLLGGEYDRSGGMTRGLDTMGMLTHYAVDIAFVGAEGLAPDGQPTDLTRLSAEQRSLMIQTANRSYIVVDTETAGRATPVRINGAKPATGIIIDSPPLSTLATALADRGLDVVTG